MGGFIPLEDLAGFLTYLELNFIEKFSGVAKDAANRWTGMLQCQYSIYKTNGLDQQNNFSKLTYSLRHLGR